MENSTFQYINPTLTKLEFGLNDGFENSNGEVQIPINMDVNVNKSDNSNEAFVELKFEVGVDDAKSPFHVVAVEATRFRWKEGLDDDIVERFLNQNAPALLLSYLRPIVSQITMASPYDAFNIPFINFTQTKKH